MTTGGYNPGPERYGAAGRRLKGILESLNQQRGTGYDVTSTSVVYAENMAFARALEVAWSTNRRLANQWQPSRMTTLLPRWERILGLYPLDSDTEVERRERVATALRRIGRTPTFAVMYDELSEALGTYFVGIEFISIANAVIHYPPGVGTFGYGTSSVTNPWYSTVAHILILTQKPTAATEGDYYQAVAQVNPIMEKIAPAWVTWDWYRAPEGFAAIPISGGPSAAGFYLDAEHNLDNNVFDV